MVRGEPEQGFERDVPVEASIVSEDKLVEIRVDVLAAQPMIGAEPPTLHQREDSMNPGQHDMAGHLADRPRVVSVIGEPGYDLCPSVSSVVPVFTWARTKASIEAAELSGIAARRIRPDRVSRYFARFRLGLAWLAPRSMTWTAPAIRIFPDFTGSKKLLSARNGISAWSTSTTPSSGSRRGSIIDRRSFCASNQAVLYVMPSWASSWTADMPFECVAMRCAAQNHTVSGNLDRCITVPAVIDVWRPQPRHSWVCARLFSTAARPPPQTGQTNPCGQRRPNKNAAQLASSGKPAWNSLSDRALATRCLLAPAQIAGARHPHTTY